MTVVTLLLWVLLLVVGDLHGRLFTDSYAVCTAPPSFCSCRVILEGIDYEKIGLKQAYAILKKQNKILTLLI